MKKHLLFSLGFFGLFFACNQAPKEVSSPEDNSLANTPSYDSIKAAKAGADAYGMRPYVMAFLKRGPNRDRSPEEAQELQNAHMKNIGRMAEEGKLVLAGPFMGDGELRGIYIFKVETVEEAEALTRTDPAIQAGSLVMELMPWYGSAALVEVNDLHPTYSQQEIVQE